MKALVNVERQRSVSGFGLSPLIKRCVLSVLKAENVDMHCEVNVFITSNHDIKRINKDKRGINKATDVLSFPAFDFIPGSFSSHGEYENGFLPLGDIVISAERLKSQAARYGHGILREAAYLTVHSVLHLLGYDHTDEGNQKDAMRKREEEILIIMRKRRRG